MAKAYGVVDLFAGPGGLAEGFSKVRDADDNHPFKIELSIEMEPSAHRTLLLRSFLRQFEDGIPDAYISALNEGNHQRDWADWATNNGFVGQWEDAKQEALRLTLADKEGSTATIVDRRIDGIRHTYGNNTILVGGPPCQAYSLVGRSRNMGIADYIPEEDSRHYLYKEYIRILEQLQPAVFVMENVKGILSSKLNGGLVFDMIRNDLETLGESSGGQGYRLLTVATPDQSQLSGDTLHIHNKDFVVRAETFGIPQARHRVIVVGIRSDLAAQLPDNQISLGLLPATAQSRVRDVIGSMPKLRSGVNRAPNSDDEWRSTILAAYSELLDIPLEPDIRDSILANLDEFRMAAPLPQQSAPDSCPSLIETRNLADLAKWIENPGLQTILNHEARGHMRSDLLRYLYASIFAQSRNAFPKAKDYPLELAPAHANWGSGKFADRFRVQLSRRPSTTVTSHISKDGHYFIHPDPLQCRSLTVREAARLQTFPDDYLFLGNRTQQYVQVGNAVPPYLANQIGRSISNLLHGLNNEDL